VVRSYVLIISLFLFGCISKDQPEIISKDIFVQILLDYENTKFSNHDTSSREDLSIICAKYGTSLQSYDITLIEYLENPEEMLIILNELKDSIL